TCKSVTVFDMKGENSFCCPTPETTIKKFLCVLVGNNCDDKPGRSINGLSKYKCCFVNGRYKLNLNSSLLNSCIFVFSKSFFKLTVQLIFVEFVSINLSTSIFGFFNFSSANALLCS